MEILTKENLAGAKIASSVVSRTFTPLLLRRIKFPFVRIHFFLTPVQRSRGCQNAAFGRRSLCLGDTRHLREFHRCPSFEEQAALFLRVGL